MENNKKELRIVCINGKYTLRYCLVDEEGYVTKVSRDTCELSWKNSDDMKKTFQEINEAKMKSICVVNANNRKDLGFEDFD